MEYTYSELYQQRIDYINTIPTLEQGMVQSLYSTLNSSIISFGLQYIEEKDGFLLNVPEYKVRIDFTFDKVVFKIRKNLNTQGQLSELFNPLLSKAIVWYPNQMSFSDFILSSSELSNIFKSE